jgi:hypothetical protein
MALFGDAGAIENLTEVSGQLYGGRYTCPEAGTAISITVYIDNSAYSQKNFKAALYETATGNLIAYSGNVLVGLVNAWITFPLISHAAITNQSYDIVVAGAAEFDLNQGAVGTDCFAAYTYTDPLPNPVVMTAPGVGFKTLIYCTYIPATTTPFLTGNKHR